MTRRSTKRALLTSVLSLLLCFTMLLSTTFAWFTDTVTSANNMIVAGNLDVELYYQQEGQTDWTKVTSTTNVFLENALWEPGHTEVVKLKIVNEGSLALQYQLGVNVASEIGSTNVNGDPFKLSDFIKFGIVDGSTSYTRDQAIAAVDATATPLKQAYASESVILQAKNDTDDDEKIVTLVVYMPTTVGNEANHKTGAAVPTINLGINLFATQATVEKDSFDELYDKDATYPVYINTSEPVVLNTENKVENEVTITHTDDSSAISNVTVTVPAGTKFEEGATEAVLKIEENNEVDAAVATQITSDQTATTYEISLEGVAADNDQEIEFTLDIEKGLLDVKLYHKGTLIDSTYDPVTGKLTFATKGFSPFTVVSATKLFESGAGTATDPYLIKTPADLLNISKYYHEYKYYKVANGVKTLDLNGIGNISLNGSFDGNGVKIENLTTSLFAEVGKSNEDQEIKISNMDVTVHTTNGRALVRNIYNAGNTIFENVSMHGYIEGQYNIGSFYNYGTANHANSDGSDYTVSFVNATSDVTLVCTTGNAIGGMLGHGYEGADYKLSINMDENSGYSGKMYTTGTAKCYQIMAMCSHATYMLNGVETSRYENTYSSEKLTVSKPVAGNDGYYVAPVEGVASYVVYLNAQLTAYDANGNKIVNLSGMTRNLGNETVTTGFDGKIFDLITDAEIVNDTAHENGYQMKDGLLTIYSGRTANYASGWVTLQVNQYDAEGNLLATGIDTVYTIEDVSTAKALTNAFAKGGKIILSADIALEENTTITINKGVKVELDLNGHTLSSTNSNTATHNFMFDVKGGELIMKNGTVSLKHTGQNIGWNGATTVIDVTAGGVLDLENVVVKNEGGTDMNFAVHLNNWGEVTLNADKCVFDAPYCGVRVFNSGPDKNNVKITNSTVTGGTRAFWVHNYASEDFGGKVYSNSSNAYDQAAVAARLNLDIYDNNNTFEITQNAKSPIRYGFNVAVYYDGSGNLVTE